MKRRQAWNGSAPQSEAAARRHLLDVASECIAKHGISKVTLSDVAAAAGVTRPTVYRYFSSADELFNAAAVLASGGYVDRLRERVLRRKDRAERIVEALVIAVSEIPEEPHLAELFQQGNGVPTTSALRSSIVQDELRKLVGDEWLADEQDRDELAEILMRLLKSFIDDPGPHRDVSELRQFCSRWLVPMLRARFDS